MKYEIVESVMALDNIRRGSLDELLLVVLNGT